MARILYLGYRPMSTKEKTNRECDAIERELRELLDRGSVADVADFATTRLNWALDKLRTLASDPPIAA